ncbi:hypothetical protein [Botryobacter ruber]|uniref:hypothetical protein n=1 Tax=Botryobacter ruber TaxID=2171629 RepID=UPI000FEC33B9|nr:hypothetical protein [Botryobacter ruber]
MISYFRSLLPSRLILLVVLYLAIRLPLLFLNLPATVPELYAMLVGERMADSAALYRDIYDSMAPLSAMVYWLIDLLVGRSYLAYRMVAAALLLLQALLFNSILNRLHVYGHKNYIPALLYLTFGCLTFEFDMLTPLLIGNTFVILSLPYIVTVSREGLDNSRLFIGGFMLGLAALSYLPLTLFLLLASVAVFFFASSTFRSFLLMLCGFAFPYAVLFSYYFYTGALGGFLELHLLRSWQFGTEFIIPPLDLAKILVLPALVLVLSLFSVFSLPQRLVFQEKFQQLMVVWLLVSMLVVVAPNEVSAWIFVVLLPPLAYFGEYLFTGRLKAWILTLIYLLVLSGVVVLRYRQVLGLHQVLTIDQSRLVLPEEQATSVKGKSILVLGDDITYYAHNKLATPYLDWHLSQRHFSHLNEYQAVFELYKNFTAEAPEIIVDQAGLMPELQYKLPEIFGNYKPAGTGETAKIYSRN